MRASLSPKDTKRILLEKHGKKPETEVIKNMEKIDQITIDIPNSGTSAQEELDILLNLVEGFEGSGSRLEDLFSPMLIQWARETILMLEDDPEIVGPGLNIAQLFDMAHIDIINCSEQVEYQKKILMAELREKNAQIFDLTFDDSGSNPYRGEEEIPF